MKDLIRNPFLAPLTLSALSAIGACAAPSGATAAKSEDFVIDTNYDGPKETIAIVRFDEGAQNASHFAIRGEGGTVLTGDFQGDNPHQIVQNISDMVTNALVQSNRFRVLERERFDETIRREHDLQSEGWTDGNEADAKGQVKRANLLVYGSITEWEPAAAKSSAGGGGGIFGGIGALVGGLMGSNAKARVGIAFRVVDATTSETVYSGVFKGEGTGRKQSAGVGALFSGIGLGGGVSQEEAAPMNEAVRMALAQAVMDMSHELVDSGRYPKNRPDQLEEAVAAAN